MENNNNQNQNRKSEEKDSPLHERTTRRKKIRWNNLSNVVSTGIGNFFYRIGFVVGENPWSTIGVCWFIVLCCSFGFIVFNHEKDPLKLWVPKDSKFLRDTDWLKSNFEEATRMQSVLITAPNVLDVDVLKKILRLNNEILNISTVDEENNIINWKSVCFKIPFTAEYTAQGIKNRRRRQDSAFDDDFFNSDESESKNQTKAANTTKATKRPFNPSFDLDPRFYCALIEMLPEGCMQSNILELWKFKEKRVDELTQKDILLALNKTRVSPYTGHEMDFSHLLGGIVRDENGTIVSATSLLSNWFLHVAFSEVDTDKIGNMAGTEDWATEEVLLWEAEFLKRMKRIKKELDGDGVTLHYSAGRSYGDISAAAMFSDIDKLCFGGIIMFVYMQAVLSKFSWVELRIGLGSLGLLSVGMGFISGCGICSILGIFYGPVHTSLPFLLMGLGVDDIFVMMACYRKVQSSTFDKTLSERMGLMLKHAGASITVTSLTDMVAFLVGATTVLPSLQSFCLYAAVCVFFMYFYVVTFFVAIFTLDERRILKKRNSIIPCIVHDDEKMKLWCDENLMSRFIKYFYSNVILSKVGKAVVILSVIIMTGFSIESLLKLQQRFDPTWFIPEDTYLHKYLMVKREFYPNMGNEASVYMGKLNYTSQVNEIIFVSDEISNRSDIVDNVQSWIRPFTQFVNTYYSKDISQTPISDLDFRTYLSTFLFSSDGGKYQQYFRFEEKLKCGQPTPNITVAAISFDFHHFNLRDEYLPAKYAIEDIVKRNNLTSGDGFNTVWGKIFGNWITDEIIDEEIYRNIGLALIGVMACTTVLIVDLQVCFWIFICVLLTLINVGGWMQRWGLTLDLVSCIALQLAVGLCVDYAAHIGHTFLTVNEGNRTERMMTTVMHIGSAVLYGGFSTILALSMLSGSEAYTYRIFFKIFLLVISFGLFHGTVLLPVILSLVGPKPYNYSEHKRKRQLYDAPTKNGVELISFIEPKMSMSSKDGYIPQEDIKLESAQVTVETGTK